VPGQGLAWEDAHGTWRLGRASFALGARPAADDGGDTTTTVVFSRDGHEVARFELVEEFRSDAPHELGELRRLGYDLHLLSGDAPARVRAAARTLGIPPEHVRAGLDPEAKADRVRELDDADTLMVGDGLNDAPSFAASYCAATPAVDRPVLPGQADLYFLGDGIGAPRRALVAARRLRRVVRDNLILAVAYNAVAVSLCLAGLVTPVVAAVLMPLSSLGVVGLTAARLSTRRLEAAWGGP
jgi:Cu2+-exporting ATPase